MFYGNIYNLFFLLVSIGVAYFLYTDAKKRGGNAVLWGVLGFFFSIVTLIVYLVLRENNSTKL